MRYSTVVRLVLPVALAICAGCASMRPTLAQQLAEERWSKCRGTSPVVTLKEIKTDGQIWLTYQSHGEYRRVNDCLQAADREQASRRNAPISRTALSTSVTAASGDPWAVPVWKKGYEWAFRWESPRGKGTFVRSLDRIEAIDGNEFYVIKTGTRHIYYRTSDLGYFMDTVDGDVEVRHVGLWKRYPWPLALEKAIDSTVSEERPRDRQTQELSFSCVVERQETVTVPAGEFETAKIACLNKATEKTVYEIWYSPQVRFWVRERVLFSYGWQERELLSYQLDGAESLSLKINPLPSVSSPPSAPSVLPLPR